MSFQREINKITKYIVFSITMRPISTKLGTKHPTVDGIQVFSYEAPHLFPRGDKSEIEKKDIDNFS